MMPVTQWQAAYQCRTFGSGPGVLARRLTLLLGVGGAGVSGAVLLHSGCQWPSDPATVVFLHGSHGNEDKGH